MNFSSRAPIVYLIGDDDVETIAVARSCSAVSLDTQCFKTAESLLSFIDVQQSNELHGCIVSDLCMPGMTGVELLKILTGRGCPLPFVLLTGAGDIETCRNAMKAGAFDFVEKDYTTDKLMASVKDAIALDARRLSEVAHIEKARRKVNSLTPKEREVLALITEGAELNDISLRLGITPQTASKHRTKIYTKLGVQSEVSAAKFMIGIN